MLFQDEPSYLKESHQSEGDLFLNWFSEQDLLIKENEYGLGQLKYYCFQAAGQNLAPSKKINSFGMSVNRKTAALKAAAEYLERQQMIKYFSKDSATAHFLKNSNGWATHTDLTLAKENAKNELIERHLLQKSFLKYEWSGFSLVDRIVVDDLVLYLNVSKYTLDGKVGLLVGVRSKKYSGVSFGYGLADISKLENLQSWQSAIFEAVTRVFDYRPQYYDLVQDNFIQNCIGYLLKQPFDFTAFKSHSSVQDFFIQEKTDPKINFNVFDLQTMYELKFPLYTVQASSKDLIPLVTAELKDQSELISILNKHGISLYTETPIL